MKVSIIILGVLVACAACLPFEHGPVLTELQPEVRKVVLVEPTHERPKRQLLLCALGAGALGVGLLGATAVGAGVVGAGVIGAGLLAAKTVAVGTIVVGGALAAHEYSRSQGGHGGDYGEDYSSY